MPKLERWEEKAMKRVMRFENTTMETLQTRITGKVKSTANYMLGKAIFSTRSKLGDLLAPAKGYKINGKEFREKSSIGQKIVSPISVAVADSALKKGGELTDAYLNRDYFYPTGDAIASSAFSGRVTFDKELTRKMGNACGYTPNIQEILKGLHDTAVNTEQGLTDITWRKEVTPHMLRTAYQEELEKSFESIRKQHRDHSAFFNRQLMAVQMQVAAQHLGEIFEKFSLDLANNTDYLEAPMTFLPKAPDLHPDVEMTPDERTLLSEVTHHSLFPKESALDKLIAKAVKKQPKPTVQEVLNRFRATLDKPMQNADGQEVPYQTGTNAQEDTHRLDSSILTLREMKRRYASHNIFTRYLSSTARAERKAITQMENLIKEKLGVSGAGLDHLLNLKTPLEANGDLVRYMGIPQKEPDVPLTETLLEYTYKAGETVLNTAKQTTEVITDITYKTGETLLNTAKQTTEIITDITYKTGETVINATKAAATGITNTMSNAANNLYDNVVGSSMDFMDGVDLFEDLDDDDITQNLYKDPSDNQPSQEEVPKEPEPSKQEESKQEEPKQEERKQEESKPEEPEQEEPEQEVPQQEGSSSLLGTLASTAGTALSYLNPLNLIPTGLFGFGKKAEPTQPADPVPTEATTDIQKEAPDPEVKPEQEAPKPEVKPEPVSDQPLASQEKLQAKQTEVIRQLTAKDANLVKLYFPSMATLVYLKTLEVSLNDGSLSPEKLDESLTEANIKSGTSHILTSPAFQDLDICRSKGLAARMKTLLPALEKDPSEISRIHQQYVYKLQHPEQIGKAAKPAPEKEPPAKTENPPQL